VEQRISVAQLDELTDEQKERLQEWWKPEIGHWHIFKANGEWFSQLITNSDNVAIAKEYKHKYIPLLSIGQCLELLADREPHLHCWQEGWEVRFIAAIEGEDDERIALLDSAVGEELITALWQAVKAIL